METSNSDDNETRKEALFFGNRLSTIMLLNALFRHGRRDLPFNVIPDRTAQECSSEMDSVLKLTKDLAENKPSLVDWLHSGLFQQDEYNVPLALFLIALYEQRLQPDQKDDIECDFRELYQFLHKVTTNQPAPHLSSDSANVLHRLLSEVMEEVWPSMQSKLLNYLSEVHIYSRSAVRRTYSGKRMTHKREKRGENC
ncbi:PREDICTED: uncharacterized protein LOC105565681 [Vollenhovia emeryi]|uniref:uncharacterized protein LOC105565681 n=1 Tax=Vollenhovia emeryi TaxID=411798 RepID=UPI0005F58376|nr:PREDICTED: uncharacterized protein LOC105565681 [Vollenhovia emeryi]XP_011874469.1 PREDICTED: uncharacterized protein LOC105565681 [Vollenhovia emeryi]XP_011874470.1 PREDICTED: uncharacterized protein LOC105565681 [Vollenhovia emeryi]XP_011874471.1 PREDICTED: uncharacterized protein LOC105565681 [Vollenhovia emeryi]XP_011874472.1 PREDICTED: uncharacterized protein LOC105565681 [Vollenhovia emeryi]